MWNINFANVYLDSLPYKLHISSAFQNFGIQKVILCLSRACVVIALCFTVGLSKNSRQDTFLIIVSGYEVAHLNSIQLYL